MAASRRVLRNRNLYAPPTSAASFTLYPNNARRALRIINYVADGIHRIINLDARHSRSETLRRLEALSEKVLPTILTIPCASGLMSQIAANQEHCTFLRSPRGNLCDCRWQARRIGGKAAFLLTSWPPPHRPDLDDVRNIEFD